MRNVADTYYKAVLARDPKFDGKFFVGVKTTGIYCRPICPARPKRENVEFFSIALEAEKAGYRPCMRCRPECAPLSPAWIGKSATVQRALKLMAAENHFERNQDRFAEQLGITSRHLRRLFEAELGKTPKQLFSDSRLNFARKLIVETDLPVTDVAFSSGFSSIRRFNDAFKDRFHQAPSRFRKSKNPTAPAGTIILSLPYRPPLDWKSLIHFYATHEIGGVERISNSRYERVFQFNGITGFLELTHSIDKSSLKLEVATSDTRSLYQVVQNIRQMFDLEADPIFLSHHFSGNKLMAALYRKHPGLRIPRGWDPFETSVATILGQLVSVDQGRRLVRSLVEQYGEKIKRPSDGQTFFLFPTPARLAASSLSHVPTTQGRKEAIREFSKRVAERRIHLHQAQDPVAFREQILSIKGVGPWTAEYVSLRALGDTDAFPQTDLILQRALKKNPTLDINSFSPWRAYAAIYLWKEFAKKLSKQKGKKS